MIPDIVLLSSDAALIAQIRATLTPLAHLLHPIATLEEARRFPLALLLLDTQAWPDHNWANLPPGCAFILLGEAGTRPAEAFRCGALDFVLKRECHLKLAFIVREALATLRFRHRLARSPAVPAAVPLDQERQHINRALAAILGHAELVAASNRLPAALRPRLEAIVEAALSIRDRLDPSAHPSPRPTPASTRLGNHTHAQPTS